MAIKFAVPRGPSRPRRALGELSELDRQTDDEKIDPTREGMRDLVYFASAVYMLWHAYGGSYAGLHAALRPSLLH